MKKQSKLLGVLLLLIISMQACMQVQLDSTSIPAATQPEATITPTRILSTLTPILPTPTKPPPATAAFTITLHAVNGNVYIRRGPDFAYNPIAVLYKDSSTKVIAHDVLYKWAQVVIPNSQETGWISLQTQYAQLDGNIESVPQVTVTDWPQPGYLRNCTHHRLFIEPGKIFLETSYTIENIVWLNPGHYWIYDIDMPDPMLIQEVDMREGITIEVNEDGAGEKRQCPK